MEQNQIAKLIKKYDVPVPRYTSYPTVPDWNTEAFSLEKYKGRAIEAFQNYGKDGLSLYIHLPYCESLCTYCGCNTRITVNHAVEKPYIDAVLKEWQLYLQLFDKKPTIKEIHLGGGTPTFFSPEHLSSLIAGLLENADLHEDYEFSFEGHPNNTTYDHLKALVNAGFSRVSFGIQDFDEKVQVAINRRQSFEQVKQVTEWSRELGYKSVNFDLIYGLPFQTAASIKNTIELVERLMPERIAFYSYAHVPWKRPGQRAYSEADLPKAEEKRDLNKLGTDMLLDMGYKMIGMDHFTLNNDSLYKASLEGNLHRNFMGYTTNPGKLLVGLGVSSISDIDAAYAQNVKTVEGYMQHIEAGEFAIFKGHLMTEEDWITKAKILLVACEKHISNALINEKVDRVKLEAMIAEGLLEKEGSGYTVTQIGSQFLRNICALFDPNYQTERAGKTFSQAV